MKGVWLCLALMLIGLSLGDLPPPERSYKILMLLPVSSKSHRNVFMPVAEALADRGHQITMISNLNKPSKHPNIHEIFHGVTDFDIDSTNMFETRNNAGAGLGMFVEMLPLLARKIYKMPQVMELYERRKEFDLIVINHMFNEVIYPFAYEMPHITIATPGLDPRHSAVMGNPPNPSYIQNLVGGSNLKTIFGRLVNTYMHIFIPVFWRLWAVVPMVDAELQKHFPGLPSVLEIERNQSLTLMNSHFSMDSAVPLLPSQVEVGGMHCKPGKPLPEDLKTWIEGAGSAGVIYFSLGSVARGDTMPVKYRNMFIEAFRKMEQRVIWKFEIDLQDVPKNVLISKWLPQQDILAHPNVKVFITHGGRLSFQEASYHGTPLLVLPIFGDQPKNADHIVQSGNGLSLVWEQLSTDMIIKSLQEIITNPKYSENMATVSKLFQDQMESPTDRAVFWTEYVIRHNGAPRMRSPAVDLSWVEFLMLDVLAVLLLIVVVVLLTLRWILKKILSKIFGSSEKKKKKRD